MNNLLWLISFNTYFLKKNFFLNIIYMSMYLFIIMSFLFSFQYIYLNNVNWYSSFIFFNKMNFLGYSLLLSGIICGFMIYWLSDSRIFFNKFTTIISFLGFFYLIWLFMNEMNYMNLFIFYELFLLPSFFLVYSISPNSSSIPIAIYFLTWTQFGSLFVLLAIMYIYMNTKSVYLNYTNTLNYNLLFLLLFIGFGMKVPMWPFYYWLTKTHVEASSFFSMYLSGFLVKTAVYLFNFFYSFYYHYTYINFLIMMVMLGVIDSSIKMWHQTDLKKLIAYTTVQEMNLLFIPLLWHTELTELLTTLFMIIHCLLSSLFFFIIDMFIKSFGTSVNTQLTGLFYLTPKLSFFIFISMLFFTGLPYTSKFYIEILIFNILNHFNLELFLMIIFIANWIGVIGFCKNFFNVLFGSPMTTNYMIYDLTKSETFIFMFLLTLLGTLTYMSLIIL